MSPKGKAALLAAAGAMALSLGLIQVAEAGPAQAAPGCGDYVWIGAAGSSERDGNAKFQNNGMGRYVNQSYIDFKAEARSRGLTVTHRALDYRARRVPIGEMPGKWSDFKASADEGVNKLKGLVSSVASQCGNSQIVLAGYSQGAGVVHRVLQQRSVPRFGGALLIADPDRLTYDTAVASGTGAIPVAGAIAGQGTAQSIPTFSGASPRKFSAGVGRKVLSYCQIQDPVCSYNPGAFVLQGVTIGSHTNYDPAWWRYQFAEQVFPASLKSNSVRPFVGMWAGDVTEDMGGGGLNRFGALLDLHQRGDQIRGTVSYVTSQEILNGKPGTCTWSIKKSKVVDGTLHIDAAKIYDDQNTCGGTKARLTRKGAMLGFQARGAGTLHKIR